MAALGNKYRNGYQLWLAAFYHMDMWRCLWNRTIDQGSEEGKANRKYVQNNHLGGNSEGSLGIAVANWRKEDLCHRGRNLNVLCLAAVWKEEF